MLEALYSFLAKVSFLCPNISYVIETRIGILNLRTIMWTICCAVFRLHFLPKLLQSLQLRVCGVMLWSINLLIYMFS